MPKRKTTIIPKIKPKSKRAVQFHEKEYLPRIQRVLKDIEETCLAILVWGPGKSESLLYKKRVEILNELRENGHDSFFSEEESGNINENQHFTVKSLEYIQSLSSDLIINLRSSPGSIAEAHDFSEHKEIASKMVIFADKETKGSYSTEGALKEMEHLYRRIHFFEYPKDINECNLLSEIMEIVSTMQRTEYAKSRNVPAYKR